MGWSSGSCLFMEVAEAIIENVPSDEARKKIYERMIAAFEDLDCDTLEECYGNDKVLDEALDTADSSGW